MKKKFIVIGIFFFIFFVFVNIFYGFFWEDNIDNLLDKIYFRIKYNSREILETSLKYNKNKLPIIISKDNISVELYNINYEQSSGQMITNFKIYSNDGQTLEKLRFMLRVHDNKNVYYNKSVGDNLFVGNTDYLLYNKNLYYKLSTKGLDTGKLNDDTTFKLSNSEKSNCKNLSLSFNLDKNYKISDSVYIEFLDLIYKLEQNNSYKIFNYLGEFRYKISF